MSPAAPASHTQPHSLLSAKLIESTAISPSASEPCRIGRKDMRVLTWEERRRDGGERGPGHLARHCPGGSRAAGTKSGDADVPNQLTPYEKGAIARHGFQTASGPHACPSGALANEPWTGWGRCRCRRRTIAIAVEGSFLQLRPSTFGRRLVLSEKLGPNFPSDERSSA